MVGVRPDGNTAWGDSWAVAWRALLASRVVVLVAGALGRRAARPRPAPHGLRPRGHHDALRRPGRRAPRAVRALGHDVVRRHRARRLRRRRARGVLPALSAAPGRRRHGDRRRDGARRHRDLDRVRGGGAHGAAPARRAGLRRPGSRAAPCSRRRSCRCRSSSRRSTASRCSSCSRWARCTRRGRDRWAWAGVLGGLSAATRSAGVVLLVPLVLLWWDAQGRGARATSCGWRSSPRASGRTASTCGRRAATRRRRSRRRTSGSGSSRGRSSARGTASWPRGRARASSCPGSREPVFFTQAGGDPFVVARHNIELFAWLVAGLWALALGCAGCRSRTSPTSSRRSRCRSPIRSCPSRSCRCHASCSCCSRSPSPSQPGRRSGAGAGRCS